MRRVWLSSALVLATSWQNVAKSVAQTPSYRSLSQLADRRIELEHELSAERNRGKAAEDPSIQELEDDLLQARFDEEVAKQPRGLQKGPKQYLRSTVLYATSRARQGSSFSSELRAGNTVEFGVARVTIETSHGISTGNLPNASFVPRADAGKGPELTTLNGFEEFRTRIHNASISSTGPRRVLLFVHGFNTSFESALERTVLVSSELQSSVVPITYSWPSAGSIRKYSHDEEVVSASAEAFEGFLKQIIRNSPFRIVVVCHSMGARQVTTALSDLAKEKVDTSKLDNIVFVAADIFTSEFQSHWVTMAALKNVKYSFYASDSDFVLKCSFLKHDAPRLGNVDSNIWPPPGAYTIDASTIDSVLFTLGHSYIENPQLGVDIGTWIRTGDDPLKRGLLKRSTQSGDIYYFP